MLCGMSDAESGPQRSDATGPQLAIVGSTAVQIAGSVRALLDANALAPGDGLPSARDLAARLGVNRNTVVAAYRQLVTAGLAVTNRGAGTRIARRSGFPEEGFTPDTALRDVGSGNPDPAFLPDPTRVRLPSAPPVLYGEQTIDPGLGAWARDMFARDVDRPFELTVTNGAVDATEKLLAQALTPGESVALEDPCFLTSINAVRRAGYRPVPVEIDADGMLPEALARALADGARAVVCTPRAHNPTGASLTEERAAALRAVLADHPHVLVIEDDHFSALARTPYRSIIPDGHRRWALIRSFSKILGPDLRVGVVASDPDTAQRFTAQIGAGSTWVSHLLQRTVHALVTDEQVQTTVEKAAQHYTARNDAFVARLAERGIAACSTDGVNVWVDAGPEADAHRVHTQLMLRGWVARTGDSFALTESTGVTNLRLTVHQLDDAGAEQLAQALADAIAAAQRAHA